MAEFGQTGKWIVLPVKLCVLFLGAYYIFVGVFKLGAIVLGSLPEVLTINNTAKIFGDEPSADFISLYPESAEYPVVEWLVQLYVLQLVIYCIAGFLSLLALFCFYRFAAYSLYLLTWAYGFVYFLTHVGILYCYQQRYLLDFIPNFRSQKEFQVLFFGELSWPSSFWYQFAAQILLHLYTLYTVSDLYYSWYQILQAGGSGWELLPPNELPGWDRYQAKLRKKEEEAMKAAYGDQEDEEGAAPSPEEMQLLMQYLQQMGGGQGIPGMPAMPGMPGMGPPGMQGMGPPGMQGMGPPGMTFGEVPPRMGIPVRQN